MDFARPSLTQATPSLPSFEVTPSRRAAFALLGSIAVGVATQALFWRTRIGLNFFLWALLAVAACYASVRPRRLTSVAQGAIVAALLLALAVVRFAGDWTFAIAVPTCLALLVVLPVALRDEVGLARAARLPVDALRAWSPRPLSSAVRAASTLPGVALGGRHETMKQLLRGLAVGVPVAALFGVLLSTDVDFGRLLVRVEQRVGDGLSFVAWAVVTAVAALVMHVLHQRRSASAVDAPALGAYRRHDGVLSLDPPAAGRLAVSTWLMVIGQVAAVFAAFVAVNVRHLFGGDAFVRAPGSLTYAKYLHAGFGQLVCASALSVWLVVLGHSLLRPRSVALDAAPHAVPGGRLLLAAESTLLGLTALTVVSCAQRLAIYEDAYGATRLRLGVAFVVLAVLGALTLTLVKVVRRAWTGYGGALAALFVALAVVASWVNADAYVARTNLDRAARGKALDLPYLMSLSIDARGVLSHPVVARDPALEQELRAAYCTDRSERGWRALRGVECPSM